MPCSIFPDALVPLSLACYVLSDYETERLGLYREMRSYLSSSDCDTVEQLIDSCRYILRNNEINDIRYFSMEEIRYSVLRPMAAVAVQDNHIRLVQELLRQVDATVLFTPSAIATLCEDLIGMKAYLERQQKYFRGQSKQKQRRFLYVYIKMLGQMLHRSVAVRKLYGSVGELTFPVSEDQNGKLVVCRQSNLLAVYFDKRLEEAHMI